MKQSKPLITLKFECSIAWKALKTAPCKTFRL